MVYVIAAVLTGLLAWLMLRKPKQSTLSHHRSRLKRHKATSVVNKDDYLTFDFEQGDARLAHTQPAAKADCEIRDKFCKHLDDVPALPSVWSDLLRAIERGEAARKVAQLIKHEPTLAAEVLRHANTMAKKDINDLGQAIVLLGYNAVRGIVTRYCFAALKPKTKTPYKNATLWKHAIAVSALAGITAKYIPGCDSGVAGTLGLLHDLGRIGINIALCKRVQIKPDAAKGYLQYERDTFGITHLEAGGLLAAHWQLPSAIQDGIMFHHHPAFAEPEQIPEHIRKEVLAVYLADILAIHFELGGGHSLITLPRTSYISMMSESLENMANDPAVSKELWRVSAIDF